MKKNDYHSQILQDKIIDFALMHKKKGAFLDIGAHDGVTFSNTFFFEKTRNWIGICIEPNPDVFNQLIKNRNCICENCCIAKEERTMTYRKVEGHWHSEMLSGILELLSPGHIERINNDIHLHNGSFHDIPVECKKINTILNKHQILDFDYVSVDTEGAELAIIESLDFELYQFKILSIEANKENNHRNNRIKNLLQKQGYVYCVNYDFENFYTKSWRLFIFIFMYINTVKAWNLTNIVISKIKKWSCFK
jgi:FkbM family methyltransferase